MATERRILRIDDNRLANYIRIYRVDDIHYTKKQILHTLHIRMHTGWTAFVTQRRTFFLLHIPVCVCIQGGRCSSPSMRPLIPGAQHLHSGTNMHQSYLQHRDILVYVQGGRQIRLFPPCETIHTCVCIQGGWKSPRPCTLLMPFPGSFVSTGIVVYVYRVDNVITQHQRLLCVQGGW